MVGDKRVCEGSAPPLGQAPLRSPRPRSRQLAIAETGTHADLGVVQRHIVAPHESEKGRADDCGPRPQWLARDESIRLLRDLAKQPDQSGLVEVMEKQVGDGDIARLWVGAPQPFEYISTSRFDIPAEPIERGSRFRAERWAPIDQHGAHAGGDGSKPPRDAEQKGPVSRSQVDNAGPGDRAAQGPSQKSRMPHQDIDLPEIAPGLDRARIVGLELIEELRAK